MLGVNLSGTSLSEVLGEIEARVARRPLVIFTPNPEFLVHAYHHSEFARLLNQADYNLPDGVGIIIWQRIWRLVRAHRDAPLHRVSGSLLAEKLLALANQHHWQIGIAGARRGDQAQQKCQLARLRERFPCLRVVNLDEKLEIRNLKLEIVFGCHGMVKQEEWILAHKDKIKGSVFVGVGGSLDYLTGFAPKPSAWVRRGGVEWLWRLITRPGHLPRVLRAVFEFSWLMVNEITRFESIDQRK
ncbi:MAG: WecB/TagA/CpsF family glycosyltransferase [Candidatus Shapirobacteria bacterium]